MNEMKFDYELKHRAQTSTTVIPDIVRHRIDQTLMSLPSQQKQPSSLRKIAYTSTAAAVLLGCVIGSGFVSPTMASALKQVPLLQSVFTIAGDMGLKTADERGFSTALNQSATDKGITLTISEVLFDGSRFSIGYIQESPTGIRQMKVSDIDFFVNGKTFHSAGSAMGNPSNDKKYMGVITLTPEEQLPNQFQLEMRVNRIGNVEGQWKFSFPVSAIASANTKTFIPMQTQSFNNVSITVKKVMFTPSTTEINLEIVKPLQSENMEFQVLDDKGTILQNLSGSGSSVHDGQQETLNWQARYAPVSVPKSIHIRPLMQVSAGEQAADVKVEMDHTPTPDHPITISQGKAGQLQINKVEFLNDQTFVHYQVTNGIDPFAQSNPLWIEDEKGEKHINLQKAPVVVQPETYSFVREYPALNPNQRLKFVTREIPAPRIMKELEITVPLDK